MNAASATTAKENKTSTLKSQGRAEQGTYQGAGGPLFARTLRLCSRYLNGIPVTGKGGHHEN
jgi:hypothetical protein